MMPMWNTDANKKIRIQFRILLEKLKRSLLLINMESNDGSGSNATISNLANSDILTDILPNFCDSTQEKINILDQNDVQRSKEILKYIDINSCNHTPTCKSRIMCLKPPLSILNGRQETAQLEVSHETNKCSKQTALQLASLPGKELEILHEDLIQAVEKVSSQLVSLLLENDALQQESDARNVAIEQLLKLTVKNTESELRPIQMSVVLPKENCDEL